jgi:hypothetical protein
MASVRKRGNSYQVTVSNGRDSTGKQILVTDTFTPDPGMTKRQIEKALNEFVVDFERDVKTDQNYKSRRMTLKELSESFLTDTKPDEMRDNPDALSITTWDFYQNTLKLRIIPKLGHGECLNRHQTDR